jgi:hypothetical protein
MYLVVCVPRAESGGAGTPVAAVSLDLSGLHHLTATGAAAYVLVILAGVGFAVGLTAVTRAPRGPIHCGRCRRYLPQNARRLASMPVCGADM